MRGQICGFSEDRAGGREMREGGGCDYKRVKKDSCPVGTVHCFDSGGGFMILHECVHAQ